MAERGVDAQPMFMSASLMCILWLAAIGDAVEQAGFTDFAGHTAPLMNGQVVLGDTRAARTRANFRSGRILPAKPRPVHSSPRLRHSAIAECAFS
jgi:hypothetical protein